MENVSSRALLDDIDRWLAEDVGAGDVTSLLTIEASIVGSAVIVAKQDCIVAGLIIAEIVFRRVDEEIEVITKVEDGASVVSGAELAIVTGSLRSILCAERLALNLLQRMSGVATLTAAFVGAVEGTKAKILDTRKTTPGLRYLEKYAVTIGGGHNHRFGLFDGVLIKDNHIEALGSVFIAVRKAKDAAPHYLKVEVEVSTMDELEDALAAGADIVLLDNMSDDEMREAVRRVDGSIVTEASGNMSLDRVSSVALTGVDLISVGALTHSVSAVDISLDFI